MSFKRLFLLPLLASVLAAQVGAPVKPHTLPDITGSGATVQLSVSTAGATAIQLVTPSTNAAVVRWGDASTSATQGSAIAAGGGQWIYVAPNYVTLNSVYLYIGSGDKVTVTYFQ